MKFTRLGELVRESDIDKISEVLALNPEELDKRDRDGQCNDSPHVYRRCLGNKGTSMIGTCQDAERAFGMGDYEREVFSL
jgi:hypothetical protein